MQRDDQSGIRPAGPAPSGAGSAPEAGGDAVLAALAHRLRARSERQQLLTERLRSGELRPGALADLAELAAAARRGARDGDHILVMSGSAPSPRGGSAVPLGQALSSAVSASEAASRTVVPPAPSVSLDSAAEPVFGQILAELLAHAVIVTAPGERLELHGRFAPDGGVLMELLCTQPAQNRPPVDDLDRMLAAGRPDGPVAPQEIGLYVAARLARAIGARLGIRGATGTVGVPGLSPIAVLQLPPSVLSGGHGGQDVTRNVDVAGAAPSGGIPAVPDTVAVPTTDSPAPWPPMPARADSPANGLPVRQPATGPGGHPALGRAGASATGPGRPAVSQAGPQATGPGGQQAVGQAGQPATRQTPPGGWPQPATGPQPGQPPAPFGRPEPSADSSPVTEALPVPGSTPPVELFGPFDSEPPVAVDDVDGTPIFAAVASAWFRDPDPEARTPAGGSAPAAAAAPSESRQPSTGPQNWATAGDAEFEAARQRANRALPTPTTAQGLPQRRPGQQMVPPPRRDQAASAPRSASSLERQPDRVRNRLSSYQRGLREGRHRASEEHHDDGPGGAVNGRQPWRNGQMAQVPDVPPSGHGEPEHGPNGVAPYGRNGHDGRNVG